MRLRVKTFLFIQIQDSSYCEHCDLWDSLKVSLLGKVTTFLLKCDWYRKECTFKIHLLKKTALNKNVNSVETKY